MITNDHEINQKIADAMEDAFVSVSPLPGVGLRCGCADCDEAMRDRFMAAYHAALVVIRNETQRLAEEQVVVSLPE